MSTTLTASVEDLARVIDLQREIATSPLGLEELMRLICTRTRELIPVSGSVVELVDGSEMVYRAVDGLGPEAVGLRLAMATSLSGLSVLRNEVLRCDDVETDARVDREVARRLGLRSFICVPLIDEGQAVGVLKVLDHRPHAFGAREESLLGLTAGVLSALLRHAREAAAKDQARAALETLVDTAYEAVTISKNNLIAQCNPRFLEMFGIGEDQVIGRSLVDFVAPFERGRVEHNHTTGYADFYEFLARRPDGSTFACEGRGRSFEVNGERLRVSTLRDVTERRSAEESLRASEARACEAVRAKNKFMVDVGREIRAPLDDVRDLVERLAATTLAGPQAALVERMQIATTSCLRLIDDISHLARLETDTLKLAAVPFDVREVIDEVARSFGTLARARGSGIEVRAEVGLPPLVGDPACLRQVLASLIGDALAGAGPARAVIIETQLLTRGEAGYRFRVEVRGGGRNAGTPRSAVGLGERLVNKMGGEARFLTAGEASSFTLTLPAAPNAEPEAQGGSGTRLRLDSPFGVPR